MRLPNVAPRFPRRPRELQILAVAGLVATSLWAVGTLAEEVSEGEADAFDGWVLRAMRGSGPEDGAGPWWFTYAVADLTALGGLSVLSLFVLLGVGFLLLKRRPIGAAALVTAIAGGVGLSEGLKAAVQRTRPPVEYRLDDALNASFPSGHALLSAVVYLTLSAVLAQSLGRRRDRVYVLGVGVLMTGVVGLTRIYLGVHWATDVFAGWAVGVAWAAICWLAIFELELRTRARLIHP